MNIQGIIKSASLASLICFSVQGCSTVDNSIANHGMTPTGVSAATGAIIGAGLGTVIGSASGNAGEGFILGSVAGAATGGMIGHSFEEQKRDLAKTQEELNRQEETIRTQNQELEELRGDFDEKLETNNRPSKAKGKNYSLSSYNGSPKATPFQAAPAKDLASNDTPTFIERDISQARTRLAPELPAAKTADATLDSYELGTQDQRSHGSLLPNSQKIAKEKVEPVANSGFNIPPARKVSASLPGFEQEDALQDEQERLLKEAQKVEEARRRQEEKLRQEASAEKQRLAMLEKKKAEEKKLALKRQKELKMKAAEEERKLKEERKRQELASKKQAEEKAKAAEKKIQQAKAAPEEKTAVIAAKTKNDPGCSRALQEADKAYKARSAADRLYYFRRALRFCPGEASYHVEIGKVYMSVGRNRDAQYEFEQATRLDPAHNEAQRLLADAGKER